MSSYRSSAPPRATSASRPMPPIPRTTKSTYSSGISAATGSIHTRRPSVDRSVTQRTLITDPSRSRLPTNDRINATATDYLERRSSIIHPSSQPLSVTNHSDEPSTGTNTSSALEAQLYNGGLTGLQNLGNTCFMNSVLQCLSNTKPLLLFCFDKNLPDYLNRSSTSVMKGVLMREYVQLIQKMWLSTSSHAVVSPSTFKSTIGRFAPRFLGYAQQDSQEFLRYVLQGLHEDVNRVQRKPTPIKIDEAEEERLPESARAEQSWERCLKFENSNIVDIFAGQLKSTLECTTCRYQSITFDMFWDLSIPLPRNKSSCHLQECLQLFMEKEELDGNEKPTCARCKQKRRCTKQFSIQKCPTILVLHLKRFSQTRGRAKLNTHVDFPLTNLRLTGMVSGSPGSSETAYDLFGVSYHSGTAYSGHYIARCKHPFTHQWYEFNDSSVHPINDSSRIVSSDAYVLFYERKK